MSCVNFHTNATRIGQLLWEIDSRFAHNLPSGWRRPSTPKNPPKSEGIHWVPPIGPGNHFDYHDLVNFGWLVACAAGLLLQGHLDHKKTPNPL